MSESNHKRKISDPLSEHFQPSESKLPKTSHEFTTSINMINAHADTNALSSQEVSQFWLDIEQACKNDCSKNYA